MPETDRFGLPLSTRSAAAAAAYRDGVDRQLAAWTGIADAFDAAIAADPDFALAHLARGRLHATYMEAPKAAAAIARARSLVTANGTRREQSHVDALALAVEGQAAKSLQRVLEHLEQWPRDAVVLSSTLGAFGLYAFSGMADHDRARVEICEKFAPHYGDDWWFQTYLGWSYTEHGDVVRGRRITERAFAQRRENASAAHALAHAMFEDGSVEDAEHMLADWLPIYDRSAMLNGHMSWHQALLALERDDPAGALAIYADRIAPDVTHAFPLNAMTDGVSLLWRLYVYGHAVPRELWDAAASYAAPKYPRSGNPFADVHLCALSAATGDTAGLAQRLTELDTRLAEGKLPAGPAVPAMGRALQAFATSDFNRCAALLEPFADDVVRIGGSHAQRELVEDTLLVALMKSGQSAKAHALLDQRLHRRPSLRDARWRAVA